MTKEKLAENLQSLVGFKSLFNGLFGGGKAKKSFEIFSSAPEKGVLDLVMLRTDSHDDFHYAVFAFSKKGTIDPNTLQMLKDAASEIPLGTIRYESIGYSKLQLWRGGENSFANEHKTITTLAGDQSDIFVFPVAEGKLDNLQCPYVIYAHKEGQDYIYPVPVKKLK